MTLNGELRRWDVALCEACGYTFVNRKVLATAISCRRCASGDVRKWRPGTAPPVRLPPARLPGTRLAGGRN